MLSGIVSTNDRWSNASWSSNWHLISKAGSHSKVWKMYIIIMEVNCWSKDHTVDQIGCNSSQRTCWWCRLCGQDVSGEVISDPADICRAWTNVVGTWSCGCTGGGCLNDVRVVFARSPSAAQSNWKQGKCILVMWCIYKRCNLKKKWKSWCLLLGHTVLMSALKLCMLLLL